MPHSWDPDRYLTFADERGRPFVELLARIDATAPSTVVDLGCGPGNMTDLLAQRWQAARVVGIDASAAMIARARSRGSAVDYRVDDVATWTAPEPVDVLVSHATLQWVPDHLELLPGLVGQVTPGGWFAFGVPANFDEPSHTLREELAAEAPYAEQTAGVASPQAFDAATYLHALTGLGCTVDAWETTYLHQLSGPDPVFTWISGTSARPTLAALDAELRPRFEAELKRRLDAAYEATPAGVVLPFRRVFVVARTPHP
ncbi:trans-aconitate 2-methyltransferase [Marmoricola sp. OAE513]|uniref:methyltransferase domain-containing protein n=1 Tax=Marmoricola sp. OAE513 TaxID=2817894 RepID=UPI001AE7E21C